MAGLFIIHCFVLLKDMFLISICPSYHGTGLASLYVCLSVYLSVCLSGCLSACLSICLSFCICLSYLYVSAFVCLPLSQHNCQTKREHLKYNVKNTIQETLKARQERDVTFYTPNNPRRIWPLLKKTSKIYYKKH